MKMRAGTRSHPTYPVGNRGPIAKNRGRVRSHRLARREAGAEVVALGELASRFSLSL